VAKNNELRIGWHSLTPLNLNAGDNLMIIRLRTTEEFKTGKSIRFTLAPSQLSELADNQYNVIPNAVLSIDLTEAASVGIPENPSSGNLTLENHPNPFDGYTVIDYSLPFEGKVTLVINNLLGASIVTLVNEPQAQGDHSLKLDTRELAPGVYTATIRLENDSDKRSRTIKIVRNR
jgi:hypothetical protein